MSDANVRAVMGGNSDPMADAIARFDLVGYLLVRHETLIRAAVDDRIDRACLKVLAMLIATMNRETRTSWAGREFIADATGISVKSVSNYIYQLKCLGYVVAERRQTPQANNRVLMHYTLSKLSPEEIETAIDNAISSIRGDRVSVVQFPPQRELNPESSRPDGKSKQQVPAPTGTQVPVRAGTIGAFRQDGNLSSCHDGNLSLKTPESSRQDGCSNKDSKKEEKEEEKKEKPQRGTRLHPDWKLPRSWGDWALAECVVTEQQVRREADNFRDFWISKPGASACKLDWFATWRGWIRRTYADKSASPSLPRQSAHKAKGSVMQDAIQELLSEQGHGQD